MATVSNSSSRKTRMRKIAILTSALTEWKSYESTHGSLYPVRLCTFEYLTTLEFKYWNLQVFLHFLMGTKLCFKCRCATARKLLVSTSKQFEYKEYVSDICSFVFGEYGSITGRTSTQFNMFYVIWGCKKTASVLIHLERPYARDQFSLQMHE